MNQTDIKAPSRAQGLLSILGGALIIVSYFLPTYFTVSSDAPPPYSPADYTMLSSWNNIYPGLFGSTAFDSQANAFVTSGPHYFTIFIAMAPIILAALILVLGIWAFFKRPSSSRSAVFSTAVVILALSSVNTLDIGAANPYAFAGNIGQAGPQLSLGSSVLLLGLFITLVSAFLAWQRK